MIRNRWTRCTNRATAMILVALAGCQAQQKADRFEEQKSTDELVAQTIDRLKTADSGLEEFFDTARGYAVFPTVGKAAWIVGGAHGSGLVFERGQRIGHSTLTQLSVGVQFGGQAYSEVIFFADETMLADFKRGQFELGAQASAVAITLGASADADYDNGIAIFTLPKGGLLLDLSVGGQKFTFDSDEGSAAP